MTLTHCKYNTNEAEITQLGQFVGVFQALLLVVLGAIGQPLASAMSLSIFWQIYSEYVGL